ncbi:STAS domain-containing protein [Bacillaceae bacterium SIJ1]|uniref:STAS domain-containing protein n=1 Tax=Litoribacterium kuwaitense TaxID=1398745 RepID=UPI0013EAC217|nr:STAS domain-containing protein [Litoribacterium kuwaitense]NGP46259.1 STAS domain-containing protein [Litoribacterium kuwaitense]
MGDSLRRLDVPLYSRIMEDVLKNIKDILLKEGIHLRNQADEWMMTYGEKKLNGLRNSQSDQLFLRLINTLAEQLTESPDTTHTNDHLQSWVSDASQFAAQNDHSLHGALQVLKYTRLAIWKRMEREFEDRRLDESGLLTAGCRIDLAMDEAIIAFMKQFLKNQDNLLQAAHQSIRELSVPVVPVFDGVAILPLIGEIDTDRSHFIMDNTLKRSMDLRLNYMIIDVSGIMNMDTYVARELYQITQSLKLIGIKAYLTGLQPLVTQTIVSLGISFKEIDTFGSVQQALEHIGVVSHLQKTKDLNTPS